MVVKLDFEIKNDKKIKVFTTRPDTIFGATFIAILVIILNVKISKNENFIKFKKNVLKLAQLKKL